MRSIGPGPLALVPAALAAPGCAPVEQLTMQANPHAAVLARALVQAHLCSPHPRRNVSDVILVVSELVTRAVLGGVGPVRVELSCTAESSPLLSVM